MIRARYALAVLIGVCCLGQSPLFAQFGPAPAAYGDQTGLFPVDDGYSPVDQPLAPVAQAPWYGDADQVAEASGRYGPIPVSRGWRLRAEYLNWRVGRPGNQVLGAPVAGVTDPTQPFTVFAPGTGAPLAVATVPDTRTIDLSNISGLRVTAATDLIYGGQVEVSAFMLARKQSGFFLNTGAPVAFDTDFDIAFDPRRTEIAEGESLPQDIATSTLFNGQVADHVFLYNVSYQAIFQSRVWGGEANYLSDSLLPEGDGWLQCRPLIGFRYVNISERLTQRGVFQDFLLGGPPVVTTIDSLTMNNLYGAQIGLRTQIVTRWFEVGITPKLLFMGNTAVASVYSNHFRSNADGTFSSNDLTSKFSFGLEGQTYAQVNLSPHVSVRLGYDLLYFTQVTRPHKNIVYDDNGPASPPAISEQTIFTDLLISGWSVGMQIQY